MSFGHAPDPPPPPPPPPSPPHYAQAGASGTAYKSMQRGGLAGTILTSGQGASDYDRNNTNKSLLGQ